MNELDELLRRDARDAVDDNAFTSRVMAALPASRTTSRAWLRPALVMGSSLAGSSIAVALAPRGGSLALSVADFLTSGVVSQAMLTSLAIGAVLIVSAVVMALDSE